MKPDEMIERLGTYQKSPTPETYEALVQHCHAWGSQAGHADELRRAISTFAAAEVFLGHLLAESVWYSGEATTADFTNLWECARYSGADPRFTRLPVADHLAVAGRLRQSTLRPSTFILLGNGHRARFGIADAEAAYLEGIHRFPADPLLKLRLADLYLATFRLAAAQQILNHLKPNYPFAREMMFVGPTSELRVPPDLFQTLDSNDAEVVWFAAADPAYMDKYALDLVRSIRGTAGPGIHIHLHEVRDTGRGVSPEVAAQLQHYGVMHTVRTVDLAHASPNQRKALFASERFLGLAELIAKYRKPVVVSDIDIQCIKPPQALFDQLQGVDVGYTNFRSTTEAWERYAGTALLLQPTDNAIDFCRRLGALLRAILETHPQPWFADQIALFRMIEEFPGNTRTRLLEHILTDTDPPSAKGYFKILHGSWEAA